MTTIKQRIYFLCFICYSKGAYAGLATMYAEDKRFTEYYDKEQPGMAAFFRDAILIYTGMKKIKNRLLKKYGSRLYFQYLVYNS